MLLMGFGVFIHRSDSIYDDSPAERYQFPSQYLGRVQACVGDWIIYYEPRKVADTRGYFAMAKIERVVPDPTTPDMYLALIEPGSYLDFVNPVPFTDASGAVVEQGVLNEQGRISGRAQSAVRPLSPSDFSRIVGLGLNESEPVLPRVGDALLPSGLQTTNKRHSSSSRAGIERASPSRELFATGFFDESCCELIQSDAPSAVSS